MELHLPPECRLAFQLFTLSFAIIWWAHLVACVWFALGIAGPADTGHRWLDFTALPDASFPDLSFAYQYTACFQWSVAQISLGSVDSAPKNTAERIFTVMMMLAGFLF